jgi:hypothetical protein
MSERPIIFSAPMIRALLDGRKTMTRRILKPQPELNSAGLWVFPPKWTAAAFVKWGQAAQTDEDGLRLLFESEKAKAALPYAVGDSLWVREAWRTTADLDDLSPGEMFPSRRHPVSYEADYNREPNDGCRGRLRPSIHMPRWASRITLRVTAVRVQRLQEITEEDAKAEGIFKWFGIECFGYDKKGTPGPDCLDTARDTFAALWERIHGPASWEANPWVAAITFERVP